MDATTAPPPIAPPTTDDIPARRRSLPPLSSKTNDSSANQVRVHPASPEVISSLISSLSALSSPVEDHFENLPPAISQSRSTPTSPSAYQSKFPPLHSDHNTAGQKEWAGLEAANLASLESQRDRLHPDDAVTPRSPRSPLGPRPESEVDGHALMSNYWRGTLRTASGELDDENSIGSLSIEPANVPFDSTRRSSASTEGGKRGRRSHFGLMYMGSKERLREKEGERKKSTLVAPPVADGLGLNGFDISQMNAFEAPMAETPINEELEVPKMSHVDVQGPPGGSAPESSANSPPVRSTNSSPGIGTGRFIPVRESSLRKTSNSPSRSKRRSHHSGRYDSSNDHSRRASAVEDDQEAPEPNPASSLAERRKSKKYPASLTAPGPVNTSSILFTSPAVASARAATAATWAAHSPPVRRGSESDCEESAPSPAIVQRKIRDGSPRIDTSNVLSAQTAKRSMSAGPSADWQLQSAPLPSRRNSRLQKRRPSSPSHHRRTLTGPLNRNADGTARPTPVAIDDRPSSADSIDNAVDSYIFSARLSQRVTHPHTGRIISFSEVGDPEGFAVFCCVGMGLTRYITAFYDELAQSLKLRLITPDRPGVGDSEPHADGTGTPLGWPDDVYTICQALKINKFSILAHSAGAIYALATALRMPQHIRGRIHLLAPWIPPSQMSVIGSQQESPPAGTLPTSQRILRALPTPVLKVANSSFMSATSTSITSSLPKSPRRKRKNAAARETSAPPAGRDTNAGGLKEGDDLIIPNTQPDSEFSPKSSSSDASPSTPKPAPALSSKERQADYDTRLTQCIWDAATNNANPAVDLLVCLERRQPIGFRYVDITRAVVIHHGSRDSRVPVENVRWLAKTMRRCEVRVLEGEGHGLMASASVMGTVLMEIAREWEDWMEIVNNGRVKAGGGKSEWAL